MPDGVPFASADTNGWHNVPVLSELAASLLDDLGPRSAVVGHLVALALTLVVLASAARRRGAGDRYVALGVVLLCLGSLATFGIVRAQTFSLVPFALLVALVSSQARRPDRRIWWVVPVVAVWANLHGGVLLGVCVLGAYLLLERIRVRPWESVMVGVVSLLAVCATVQLWRTPAYYFDVFDNVSAQRGDGLWARPRLDLPFDVMMGLAALVLVVLLLRVRRPAWEYVACLGLVLATASAARNGVWLLCVLVVVAAGGTGAVRSAAAGRTLRLQAMVPLAVAALGLAVALPLALVRGDAVLGAPPEVVARIADVADGGVVLAPAPLSESLAVAGVRAVGRQSARRLRARGPGGVPRLPRRGRRSAPGDPGVRRRRRSGGVGAGRPRAGRTRVPARACGDDWTCFVRSAG